MNLVFLHHDSWAQSLIWSERNSAFMKGNHTWHSYPHTILALCQNTKWWVTLLDGICYAFLSEIAEKQYKNYYAIRLTTRENIGWSSLTTWRNLLIYCFYIQGIMKFNWISNIFDYCRFKSNNHDNKSQDWLALKVPCTHTELFTFYWNELLKSHSFPWPWHQFDMTWHNMLIHKLKEKVIFVTSCTTFWYSHLSFINLCDDW